jgi:hypothetical protein
MEVITALPHTRHGMVLIFVWTVGKRKTQWKVNDLASLQLAGEWKQESDEVKTWCSVQKLKRGRSVAGSNYNYLLKTNCILSLVQKHIWLLSANQFVVYVEP